MACSTEQIWVQSKKEAYNCRMICCLQEIIWRIVITKHYTWNNLFKNIQSYRAKPVVDNIARILTVHGATTYFLHPWLIYADSPLSLTFLSLFLHACWIFQFPEKPSSTKHFRHHCTFLPSYRNWKIDHLLLKGVIILNIIYWFDL